MNALPRNLTLIGDALEQMRQLPDSSIDLVATSPPYSRLRDYGVEGQLGLEPTVDDWVDNLHAVAREVARVLVPTGTFWLNVGDTYSTHASQGAERKSLLLAPERLALRLIADGWVLRNKIVWAKANPVPTSVRDRLTASHEFVYVFVRRDSYFFDLDAIRVPHTSRVSKRHRVTASVRGREAWRGPNAADANGLVKIKGEGRVGHPLGKNPSDVWRLASSNFRGAHHATYPVPLIERMILAGCPEARCSRCRSPWRREVIRSLGGAAVRGTLGPSCACGARSEPGIVLDPFMGSGTTAIAAEKHGRDWLGVEINPKFTAMANARIEQARDTPRSQPIGSAA